MYGVLLGAIWYLLQVNECNGDFVVPLDCVPIVSTLGWRKAHVGSMT